MDAKSAFCLTIIESQGNRAMIGDGAERFTVRTSALAEEIDISEADIAEDGERLRAAYDAWCQTASI